MVFLFYLFGNLLFSYLFLPAKNQLDKDVIEAPVPRSPLTWNWIITIAHTYNMIMNDKYW